MRAWSPIAGLLSLASLCGCAAPGQSGAKVWTHSVKDINGLDVDLAKYQGKVALIVNVASKCGYTPQYTALESVYQKFKDKDFVVLGFPSNDFLWQEPGTNEDIKKFCTLNYNVTFDLFAKVSVRGGDASPLYKDLTSKKVNGPYSGAIKWNFTKFLVGRDGVVVARFGPSTTPDAPEVLRAIEAELDKPA